MVKIKQLNRANNYLFNKNINNEYWNFYSYYYVTSILFENTKSSISELQIVGRALIYILRHSIELGLKVSFNSFSYYTKSQLPLNNNSEKHSILKLYNYFLDNLNKCNDIINFDQRDKEIWYPNRWDELRHDLPKLKSLIDVVHNLDPSSTVFRYQAISLQGNQEIVDMTNLERIYIEGIKLLLLIPKYIDDEANRPFFA